MQDDILQPLLSLQESMEFAMKFLHSGINIGYQKQILVSDSKTIIFV